MTGYEVANLAETLTKAKAAGADVLVPPYKTEERNAVVVRFPGVHRRDPFRRKEIETQPPSEVAQKQCRAGSEKAEQCL
jgi:hypothetical protein